MPSFGRTSKARLLMCHADLQVICHEVIKITDFSVLCGHRNQAEQDKAFNAKPQRSKLRWPDSKHNRMPSMAVDIAPYPIEWTGRRGLTKTKAIGRFYLLAGLMIGTAVELKKQGLISHRLRFGGDWDMDGDITDQRFEDLAHFELKP